MNKGYTVTYDREKEFIVLKRGKPFASHYTRGMCITFVARNMKSGKTYRVYPDTTYRSWEWWNNLALGDIFTGVSIRNEPEKKLNSQNQPRVTGHINMETGEET
jgi:hypothetical protein